ncbi:MAG: UbiA family prenyltransferase [Alcanivoracaceae bacterium]
MSQPSLTLQSPLGARLGAWFKERFPPANALLFFILYLTCAAVARHEFGAIGISLVDVMGCLVAWSYFLVLRIFDEHKDYQLDLQNHPHRVLQSGLITLAHLRVLAVIAIAAQVIWSLYVDDWRLGPATQAWGLAFLWTCLMGKEFFCGAWLEKRLTLYAFSHMLVMPLLVWWLANLGASGVEASAAVLWLMAVAFASGFAFEITRKARGTDEEREGVDSYSRIFGTRGAALVITLLVLTMGALQLALIHALCATLPWWAWLVIGVFSVLALDSIRRYAGNPTESARERNEGMVALLMLAGYAVTIAASLASAPVTITLW